MCAESIYDGTWSGNSPAPQEVADYELMREMHWSWADMCATPLYVKRFCTDCMMIRRRAEAHRANHRS